MAARVVAEYAKAFRFSSMFFVLLLVIKDGLQKEVVLQCKGRLSGAQRHQIKEKNKVAFANNCAHIAYVLGAIFLFV